MLECSAVVTGRGRLPIIVYCAPLRLALERALHPALLLIYYSRRSLHKLLIGPESSPRTGDKTGALISSFLSFFFLPLLLFIRCRSYGIDKLLLASDTRLSKSRRCLLQAADSS